MPTRSYKTFKCQERGAEHMQVQWLTRDGQGWSASGQKLVGA